MRIRGAPLIAIVAVLGLAVDLTSNETTVVKLQDGNTDVKTYIYDKMTYLKTSRPTAVNLFNAMEELKDIVEKSSNDDVVNAIVVHAQFMLE